MYLMLQCNICTASKTATYSIHIFPMKIYLFLCFILALFCLINWKLKRNHGFHCKMSQMIILYFVKKASWGIFSQTVTMNISLWNETHFSFYVALHKHCTYFYFMINNCYYYLTHAVKNTVGHNSKPKLNGPGKKRATHLESFGGVMSPQDKSKRFMELIRSASVVTKLSAATRVCMLICFQHGCLLSRGERCYVLIVILCVTSSTLHQPQLAALPCGPAVWADSTESEVFKMDFSYGFFIFDLIIIPKIILKNCT